MVQELEEERNASCMEVDAVAAEVGIAAIRFEEEGWGMGTSALIRVSIDKTLSLVGFANL